MTTTFDASRREFLKTSAAVGGGLAIGFHLPSALAAKAGAEDKGVEIDAWVVIRPDDSVIIRYARAEMGQGSMTSAPMLVAEELECDWKKVRVEYASPHEHILRKRVWGDMASVGSRTIRLSQEYLRKGGATAREMLIAAAAQKWNVPATECVAASGVITHTPSGRKTSFGKVANAAARLEPPKEVKLKDPKDWKIVGKSMPRFDIPATVRGMQRYGIDTQLPGMVYAAVAQCPVFGGKLKSFDAARVQGRRGIIKVVAVDNDGAVAVIADNWWRAKEALKDLPLEWDIGANGNVSSASIMEFLRAGQAQPAAPVMRRAGDVDQALASAANVIEAEYFTPYLAHSPLEPMGCTAVIKDGRVEVWTSTQNAEGTLAVAAATAGVPLENVEVHKVQLGGGFGRRGTGQDFTRIGVSIAKTMEGTPVKSLWTREEDTQHDFYRPVALYRLKAGLDASGNPTGWYTRIAAPSILSTLLKLPLKDGIDPTAVDGFVDFPYGVPNVRMEYAQRDTHVPVGFWRTVSSSQNPVARECFMDELAHAAGKDPYEYRRMLLAGEKRPLGVLEAVAKAAGWGNPLPQGVFRGIAVTEPFGSYTAAVIEVSVNDKGGIKIHRIVQGIDCGYAVNPDNILAQIQGSVVYALTAIMWGEITIKDGRVEQSNFHDYPMLRLKEMPRVEMVLAPTGGFWGGVGEPAQAPVAPALLNAIFAATGKRIRSLPLKNHGLTMA
ncbi:MAG: molybdopterin cofactor-binding domain-containing protein [Burkholderiales bacterium]